MPDCSAQTMRIPFSMLYAAPKVQPALLTMGRALLRLALCKVGPEGLLAGLRLAGRSRGRGWLRWPLLDRRKAGVDVGFPQGGRSLIPNVCPWVTGIPLPLWAIARPWHAARAAGQRLGR